MLLIFLSLVYFHSYAPFLHVGRDEVEVFRKAGVSVPGGLISLPGGCPLPLWDPSPDPDAPGKVKGYKDELTVG